MCQAYEHDMINHWQLCLDYLLIQLQSLERFPQKSNAQTNGPLCWPKDDHDRICSNHQNRTGNCCGDDSNDSNGWGHLDSVDMEYFCEDAGISSIWANHANPHPLCTVAGSGQQLLLDCYLCLHISTMQSPIATFLVFICQHSTKMMQLHLSFTECCASRAHLYFACQRFELCLHADGPNAHLQAMLTLWLALPPCGSKQNVDRYDQARTLAKEMANWTKSALLFAVMPIWPSPRCKSHQSYRKGGWKDTESW